MIQLGFSLTIIGSSIVLISQALSLPPLLFLAFFLIVIGCMIIPACTFSKAFEPFEKTTGTAAGIYGSLQQLGGFVIGLGITLLPESTAYPYAILILCIAAAAMITFNASTNKW